MTRTDNFEYLTIAAIAALVLLAVLPAGVAAATIFEDDFESGNLHKWTVQDDVYVETGGTYAPSWGGYYAVFDPTDTSDERLTVTIDSTGYVDITLCFARRTVGSSSDEPFRVRYDPGTGFTTLTSYYGNLDWDTFCLDLPASADNNPSFRIRFELDDAADSGEYALLDNVTVTGEVCNSQSWYLSDDADTTNGADYIMYQGYYATTGWLDVPIATGNCRIWIANASANNTAVTFGAGTWGFTTRHAGSGTVVYNASIGVWDPDSSNFKAYGNISGNEYPEDYNPWTTLSINADPFNVPKGDFLALRVCNRDTSDTLEVDCTYSSSFPTGPSRITSPCSDPGYPYPELATVVLFGVGLLALLGYVGYRKRKGT